MPGFRKTGKQATEKGKIDAWIKESGKAGNWNKEVEYIWEKSEIIRI